MVFSRGNVLCFLKCSRVFFMSYCGIFRRLCHYFSTDYHNFKIWRLAVAVFYEQPWVFKRWSVTRTYLNILKHWSVAGAVLIKELWLSYGWRVAGQCLRTNRRAFCIKYCCIFGVIWRYFGQELLYLCYTACFCLRNTDVYLLPYGIAVWTSSVVYLLECSCVFLAKYCSIFWKLWRGIF